MAKPKRTTSTTKKGTRAAKGKHVSKTRQAKATNGCCPVIRTVCSPTYITKKVEKYVGDETFVEKEKVQGPNKCKVTMGNKTFKNLTTEQMDTKVKELSTALTAKRCLAIVEDFHKKKAEKATSNLLKRMYA